MSTDVREPGPDRPAPSADVPSSPPIQTSMDHLAARTRAFWRRRDIRGVLLLWAALTAVLVAFSVYVPARLMGKPASPSMSAVEHTMTLFSIAASPVAAVVWSVALFSLLAWRHRSKEPPTQDGPPLRTSRPAASLWLLLSSVLCVLLLVWGLAETESVAAPESDRDALTVNVTGQQWAWNFTYPQQGGVQSDQLYLPEGRPIAFYVTSKDVVHSFWIVQMGVKIDANPGEVTRTSVLPNRLGVFDVRCAELCGLLHADMETTVHVVDAQAWDQWITARGGQTNGVHP